MYYILCDLTCIIWWADWIAIYVNLCCGLFSEMLFHLELLLLQFICLFIISPVIYHDLSSTSYVHVMSCHILPAPQHPPQRSGVEVTPDGQRWCRGRPELNQPTVATPWGLWISPTSPGVCWPCSRSCLAKSSNLRSKLAWLSASFFSTIVATFAEILSVIRGKGTKCPKMTYDPMNNTTTRILHDPPGLANGTPICQTFT